MRRKAFTLTEVLVVTSATAMLIGLLAPALNVTRQRAKAVACSSNLKQLMYALVIYEQENRTFPYGFDNKDFFNRPLPPGGYPGHHSRDRLGWWWFHYLRDTLGEKFDKGTVFWCPSRNVNDFHILCGNYGVNRAVCKDAKKFGCNEFFGMPLGLNRIRRPAETLLIVDSGYSLISWYAATDANLPRLRFENKKREGAFYVPGLSINQERFLDGTISPGFEGDAIDGRHLDKTVNVGFADSHLARLKADDLFVEEVDNGRYRNLSPLWLSE